MLPGRTSYQQGTAQGYQVPGTEAERSLYGLIRTQAARTPEAPAILAPGRKPLTYDRLRSQVDSTARALCEIGIERKDRVAIMLPNGPEMAVAILAVSCLATSAPLNPQLGSHDLSSHLRSLKATALLSQEGMGSSAKAMAQARDIRLVEISPAIEEAAGVFALQPAPQSRGAAVELAQPGDIAMVLYTSGTTSQPKVVPLTHTNLCAAAHNSRDSYGLVESDRCLGIMPLYHLHGIIAPLLASLAAGASVVCTPGFEAVRFLPWLAAHRPTWYSAVPAVHQAILSQASLNLDLFASSSLRFIRSCSAALPPGVMTNLEQAFGVPVIETYSMSEALHIASNGFPPARRKPGSVGKPAGMEVIVADSAGNPVPAGEEGEILVHGDGVFPGYDDNPEANRFAFINGWFRTGDRGRFDEEGCLFITGRIKEIINRGGVSIAPQEVDDILQDHPEVEQAVTFAVPHPTLGEDMAAVVVLRKGAAASERQLQEWVLGRLATHKIPSQILFADSLPAGTLGKVPREKIAEAFAWKLKPAFSPPSTPLETRLAAIWADLLSLEQIGIEDNFFALGGDSLRATQLVSRVRAIFRVELPLESILREPVLAGQASLVEDLILGKIEGLTKIDNLHPMPPTL